MPHFPKPFYKKTRGLWYVEINRKQINLGHDEDRSVSAVSSIDESATDSKSFAGIVGHDH